MENPRYTVCRVLYPYCKPQFSKCSGQSCALGAMSNFAKMRLDNSGLVKSADLLTPSEPDSGSSAPDGNI